MFERLDSEAAEVYTYASSVEEVRVQLVIHQSCERRMDQPV